MGFNSGFKGLMSVPSRSSSSGDISRARCTKRNQGKRRTWNRTSGKKWQQFLPACCNEWCRTSERLGGMCWQQGTLPHRHYIHLSCHGALVCRASGFLLWRLISKTTIMSWLRGYFVGTSIFIGTTMSLVAILLPLRVCQEQGVRKGTKDKGGFETEHHGRSGSNFSQHAATRDAELPETLEGMCWQQGAPPHRHYIHGSECCN